MWSLSKKKQAWKEYYSHPWEDQWRGVQIWNRVTAPTCSSVLERLELPSSVAIQHEEVETADSDALIRQCVRSAVPHVGCKQCTIFPYTVLSGVKAAPRGFTESLISDRRSFQTWTIWRVCFHSTALANRCSLSMTFAVKRRMRWMSAWRLPAELNDNKPANAILSSILKSPCSQEKLNSHGSYIHNSSRYLCSSTT